MTHTIAAAPERPQIDGIQLTISGTVQVDTARVQISRHLWMDRDIDGSWTILCETEAGADVTGVIRTEGPPVAAFLDDLAAMIAEPEAFKG